MVRYQQHINIKEAAEQGHEFQERELNLVDKMQVIVTEHPRSARNIYNK